METLGALANTPIPTILVIGGIFFLLLAVASVKGIKPSPQRQQLSGYFGIGLIVAGIILFLFSSNPKTPTTSDITSTPLNEAIPNPAATQSPNSETVLDEPNIVHLGDENDRSGWASLNGDCASFKFEVQLPILEVNLILESYDATARDLIKINDKEVSIIPEQAVYETWSDANTIPLPSSIFVNGINILEFCSVPVTEGADFPGDKDDFQIRNIRVEVKR